MSSDTINRTDTFLSIPAHVKRAAARGMRMKRVGYAGAQGTGHARGLQLSTQARIPIHDVRVMNAWFARHGPDATNGGTSFRGYCQWLHDGAPTDGKTGERSKYRGAVAWLLWGGDAAYMWLKSSAVQQALRRNYPTLTLLSTQDNREKVCSKLY